MRNAVLVFLTLFFIYNTQAQDSTEVIIKKQYTTQALGEYAAPTINGILEDEAWNLVEWGGDYIEWQPDENTPPSHQTKFKILYDSKNLILINVLHFLLPLPQQG